MRGLALSHRKKENIMSISYRTRKGLQNFAAVLLCLVLAAVIVWMVWIVWLDRFVVYSRDGAQFRFDSSAEALSGEAAVPPESQGSVTIFYNDGSTNQTVSTELEQLSGYYVDASALTAGVDVVLEQIQALDPATPILLDVKNIRGYSLYSSSVCPISDRVDAAAVDSLIEYLTGGSRYVIARVPAFQDYYFGLHETRNGLFQKSNPIGLFPDLSSGSMTYWLDPTKDGTINYLTQIAGELKRLGFDEVVFTDFRFPNTTDIIFDGDKSAALTEAAATLISVCGSDSFCVSICTTSATAFTLPTEERCRLYLTGIAAADAANAAVNTGFADTAAHVVFLTELGDTRYNEFSVLRPLDTAHSDE